MISTAICPASTICSADEMSELAIWKERALTVSRQLHVARAELKQLRDRELSRLVAAHAEGISRDQFR